MNCSIDQRSDTSQLCELAISWLAPMFDAETQLFCHRRKLTGEVLVNEGASQRYTAITLLGLLEADAAGFRHSFNLDRILAGLVDELSWMHGIGDLGLLLWLCARASTGRLQELWRKVDIHYALQQARDAREGKTTELAWLLTGLSEAALAMPEARARFYPAASQTYEMLKRNQGPAGLFGHLAKGYTPAAVLRSAIGCFADQVYPIYALTQFAAAFGVAAAVPAALRCGSTICELQGEQGQWWWHYDSAHGKVFGGYPVFSVHQDGMAPLALFALAKATGQDFSSYLYKGLDWLYGNNELGKDMRDDSRQIIWRSIYDSGRYARYLAGGLSRLGLRHSSASPAKLQVKYESRPYHLGWILYAFARQTPSAAHQDRSETAKVLSQR